MYPDIYRRLDRAMAIRRGEYDYLLPALLGNELLLATWLSESDGKLTMVRRFQLVRRKRSADINARSMGLGVHRIEQRQSEANARRILPGIRCGADRRSGHLSTRSRQFCYFSTPQLPKPIETAAAILPRMAGSSKRFSSSRFTMTPASSNTAGIFAFLSTIRLSW